MGEHGGMVSGHVLHDHGASLRHLQAVHPTWKVLWRESELRRLAKTDHFVKGVILIIPSSLVLPKQRLAYAITPETEHHLVDNGEVRQFTVSAGLLWDFG